MEIKTHNKGRRWRKGGKEFKTKQQPKQKKERKRKNGETKTVTVVKFERAPPEKDTNSRIIRAPTHVTTKQGWQAESYFMYINLVKTVFVGIVRKVTKVYCTTQYMSFEYIIHFPLFSGYFSLSTPFSIFCSVCCGVFVWTSFIEMCCLWQFMIFYRPLKTQS